MKKGLKDNDLKGSGLALDLALGKLFLGKLFLISFIFVLVLSCENAANGNGGASPSGFSAAEDDLSLNRIDASGLLIRLGITAFQYGTHGLRVDKALKYALRSDEVDLERFVNKTVHLEATKIAGYPVDFGPEFLEVTRITRVIE